MPTSKNDSHSILKKRVDESFREYQTTLDRQLPNVGLLWGQYKHVIDAEYLLKLLVDGCRELFRLENSDAVVLGRDLANWHQTILSITEFKQNASFVRFQAWLDFQIARLGQFQNDLQDYATAVSWLRYCYNTNDPHTTHFLLRCGLSRDEEMRSIVFNEDHSVRDFFRNSRSPGHIYLDKLSSWFLARYDLEAAFLLLDGPQSSGDHYKLSELGVLCFQRLLLNSPACWFSLLSTVFLVLTTSGYFNREIWKSGVDVVQSWMTWSTVINSSKVQTWTLLPFQFVSLLFIGLLIVFVWRSRRGEFRQFRKLLPRLFGGILVGYIPLMSSEDIWKWLLTIKPAQAILVWVLAAGLSYLYLLVEAGKAVSDGALSHRVKRDLRIRCAQVFLIGWAEAYLIGIVISELLGSTVMTGLFPASDPLLQGPLYVVSGLFGLLIPKVVLLYAPLALSLGILVQLVWEEKTATQPL